MFAWRWDEVVLHFSEAECRERKSRNEITYQYTIPWRHIDLFGDLTTTVRLRFLASARRLVGCLS